jgi:hypothetical protein
MRMLIAFRRQHYNLNNWFLKHELNNIVTHFSFLKTSLSNQMMWVQTPQIKASKSSSLYTVYCK